mmetsp:Transcript_22414/g.53206  ORF Transcript_22414/g.53206 Transcript_22414/m.53206 type:complete len:211 (-) Transcript_22414:45-677(-)
MRGSHYAIHVRGYAVLPGVDIRCHARNHPERIIYILKQRTSTYLPATSGVPPRYCRSMISGPTRIGSALELRVPLQQRRRCTRHALSSPHPPRMAQPLLRCHDQTLNDPCAHSSHSTSAEARTRQQHGLSETMSPLAQAAAIERGVGLLLLQIRRHQEELRRWRQLENHAPPAYPRSDSNSGTRATCRQCSGPARCLPHLGRSRASWRPS